MSDPSAVIDDEKSQESSEDSCKVSVVEQVSTNLVLDKTSYEKNTQENIKEILQHQRNSSGKVTSDENVMQAITQDGKQQNKSTSSAKLSETSQKVVIQNNITIDAAILDETSYGNVKVDNMKEKASSGVALGEACLDKVIIEVTTDDIKDETIQSAKAHEISQKQTSSIHKIQDKMLKGTEPGISAVTSGETCHDNAIPDLTDSIENVESQNPTMGAISEDNEKTSCKNINTNLTSLHSHDNNVENITHDQNMTAHCSTAPQCSTVQSVKSTNENTTTKKMNRERVENEDRRNEEIRRKMIKLESTVFFEPMTSEVRDLFQPHYTPSVSEEDYESEPQEVTYCVWPQNLRKSEDDNAKDQSHPGN